MKEKKYVIILIGFVALIAVAVVGYQYLSENYTADGVSGNEWADSKSSSADSSKLSADNEDEADSNNGQTDHSDTSEDSNHASKDQEEVKAVDFEVQDAQGNTVKLSDYYDKPIVVNFWATWCGPCKSELPAFEKLYEEYGKEVHFLMVNLTDGSRETVKGVKEFLEEHEYEFPVYYDTDSIAAYVYGAYSIPLSVFIDSNQNVVGYQVGAMEEEVLRTYIESMVIE